MQEENDSEDFLQNAVWGTKTARTDESSGRELTLDLFIARVQESGSLENRKRPADKSGVKHALHIVFVNLWEGARWGERRGWGAQTEREENGVHARGHRVWDELPGGWRQPWTRGPKVWAGRAVCPLYSSSK